MDPPTTTPRGQSSLNLIPGAHFQLQYVVLTSCCRVIGRQHKQLIKQLSKWPVSV